MVMSAFFAPESAHLKMNLFAAFHAHDPLPGIPVTELPSAGGAPMDLICAFYRKIQFALAISGSTLIL